MERILQRGGGKVSMKSQRRGRAAHNPTATRGLILTPTRELAAQCIGMMAAMAKFTDMRATLIVGGAKNVNGQVRSSMKSVYVYLFMYTVCLMRKCENLYGEREYKRVVDEEE